MITMIDNNRKCRTFAAGEWLFQMQATDEFDLGRVTDLQHLIVGVEVTETLAQAEVGQDQEDPFKDP